MNVVQEQSISFKILKFSVLSVFLGRAWQHLFWDAPFRAFFWDEQLLKPIIENTFGMQWKDYVTSPLVDSFIQYTLIAFGILYVFATFATLKFDFKNRIHKIILIAGGIGLVLLAYLLMKDQFYRFSQFFEYSLQFGIPFVLVFYKKEFIKRNLEFILKVLVAIVFVSHGLYAIGYYPVPGYYLGMVIDIFGWSENTAGMFLMVAGILDMVVAILIFVPKIAKYAIIYAFVWGTLTSLARIVSGFYFEFFWQTMNLNLFQAVYRLPHGLIPLMLLVLFKENRKAKINER